jgi:hypothetical protein
MSSMSSAQRTLTWGSTAQVAFTTLGVLIDQTTDELCRVESDEPQTWSGELVVVAQGFAGEANPIGVDVLTSVGVGQAKATVVQSYGIAAPYPVTFDSGLIPATQLNIRARVYGGPYAVAGNHSVTIGFFIAPFSPTDQGIQRELRAMRERFEQAMGVR